MTQTAIATHTIADVAEAEVQAAARAFAQALTESAEFQAFEEAADRLDRDEVAQRALQAFQAKQQSLQMMLMLNAVSAEERAELERLRQAFLAEPSIVAYLEAQEALTAMCQATGELLSQRIGLSFAAACGPGCC
jgi:cell fate (sporulation/competence/biofilm development) regulator YlbF (YheA/YmcA/DUF963 family)